MPILVKALLTTFVPVVGGWAAFSAFHWITGFVVVAIAGEDEERLEKMKAGYKELIWTGKDLLFYWAFGFVLMWLFGIWR